MHRPQADGIPPTELLDTTHDFPCEFTFKVIGKDERGFAARVVAAIRESVCLATDPPFRVRRTSSGRHMCVTVEPRVPHADAVLEAYAEIKRIDGVVMVL
ncbi:MAG: DUF493 domain-containing protein [Planctomycetota bacterium]